MKMFRNIIDYIKLSKEERQIHLNLDDKCIEIGGYDSREYRALLAHFLNTTIPTKIKNVLLCHACGNSKCSNVKHLYWGTRSDNEQDKKLHGTFKTPYELTVQKHGEKEAKKIQRINGSKGGKKGGGHNKLNKETITNNRRIIDESNPLKYGWVKRAANKLNVSHTSVKNFVNNYYSELDFYQRK